MVDSDRPETDYDVLCEQASGLLSGQRHRVANAANLSALVFQELADLNWAGFYFLEDDVLVLGPFQGSPACVHIPLGRGVCGTAAAQRRTLRVQDVHAFEGHIACDAASESELVVPLLKDGAVIGVFDLDSPTRGRFGDADAIGIEKLARIYVESID